MYICVYSYPLKSVLQNVNFSLYRDVFSTWMLTSRLFQNHTHAILFPHKSTLTSMKSNAVLQIQALRGQSPCNIYCDINPPPKYEFMLQPSSEFQETWTYGFCISWWQTAKQTNKWKYNLLGGHNKIGCLPKGFTSSWSYLEQSHFVKKVLIDIFDRAEPAFKHYICFIHSLLPYNQWKY